MKLRILLTILVVGSIHTFGASNGSQTEDIAKCIEYIKTLSFLRGIAESQYSVLKQLLESEESIRRGLLINHEFTGRITLEFEKSEPSVSAPAAQSRSAAVTK